jgi:hypothetical protein
MTYFLLEVPDCHPLRDTPYEPRLGRREGGSMISQGSAVVKMKIFAECLWLKQFMKY